MNSNRYFPLFVNMSEKQILVIGGGKIALRRVNTLIQFTKSIRIVALEILPELEKICEMYPDCIVMRQEYSRELLYDADFVFACTNVREINRDIYTACKCLGISVNVSDRKEECDFYFPAVAQKDEIVIGMVSDGMHHHKTARIKETIEKTLQMQIDTSEIRLGSRESKLAVAQTELLKAHLCNLLPEIRCKIITMSTQGDRQLDGPLDQIGGKGLFVKELDQALLKNEVDFCVHSLKDMPAEFPEGIVLEAVSEREDPRDVLVLPKGETKLDPSKPIGTSSLRRKLQFQALYPGMRVESVRGNLQTRLEKLDRGEYGGLILAAAGMKRMHLGDRISRYFSVEEMIPSAGQGILAVTCTSARKDMQLMHAIHRFGSADTMAVAKAERAFVQALGCGCSAPVGAFAEIQNGILTIKGYYFDGKSEYRSKLQGYPEEAESLGKRLAKKLLSGNKGKVILVGAGPGNIGLITLAAKQAIMQADMIFYDSLIGAEIKSLFPKGAICRSVGKRAGKHSVLQAKTNALLIEAANLGKTVVRLKGGDPFLFGRGSEELLALREASIPFEIIPGVPSPVAVPEYFGIPVTHRGTSASVHIYTGHREEGEAEGLDFQTIAAEEGTKIFLMSISAAETICSNLMRAGMHPDTPAAFLEKGTTSDEKIYRSTLSRIAKVDVKSPAILLIGEVGEFNNSLSWRESMPLFGKKLILTGPGERTADMAWHLRAAGAEVIGMPTIELQPNMEAADLFDAKRLQADWIVLTSPSGVRIFFERFLSLGYDIRMFAYTRFACLGAATAEALQAFGIHADFIPQQKDAKGLGKELQAYILKRNQFDPSGKIMLGDGVGFAQDFEPKKIRIFIPRAENGSPELTHALEAFSVDEAKLYRTLPVEECHFSWKQLQDRNGEIHVVFTSASAVQAFFGLYGLTEADAKEYDICAYCIGTQTANAAAPYCKMIKTAKEPRFFALEQLVLDSLSGNN